jgi:cytoskeletal protein RodZ
MGVGDVKSGISSVASGEYLDIRPPSGEEWVIHNITHNGAVELYFTDGTNTIGPIDSDAGAGGWLNFNFHVTNSCWYRVKNVSGTTQLIGYDGIQTK